MKFVDGRALRAVRRELSRFFGLGLRSWPFFRLYLIGFAKLRIKEKLQIECFDAVVRVSENFESCRQDLAVRFPLINPELSGSWRGSVADAAP